MLYRRGLTCNKCFLLSTFARAPEEDRDFLNSLRGICPDPPCGSRHHGGFPIRRSDIVDGRLTRQRKVKSRDVVAAAIAAAAAAIKKYQCERGRVFFFLRQISVCQSAKAAYYTKQRGKVLSVSLVSCSTWQPSTSCFLIPGVTIQLRFSLAYLSNNMQQHLSDRSRRIVPLVCSANTRKGERTMRTERFAFAAESDFPRG